MQVADILDNKKKPRVDLLPDSSAEKRWLSHWNIPKDIKQWWISTSIFFLHEILCNVVI